jgi:hypothetical protein
LYRSFNLDWLESAEVEILQLIENDNIVHKCLE